MPVHGHAEAYVLVVALALVWGVHWAVTKAALRYVPPFTYGAARMFLGLALLGGFLALRGRLKPPVRGDLPVLVFGGLGQMAASTAIMNVALQHVPAGRSSILTYTMPIWVAVLQPLVFRTRLTRLEWAGLAFGVAGIALLLNPAAIDWSSPDVLFGSGLLLVGAVGWAVTTIVLRNHEWNAPPIELIPWELLIAAVPLSVLAVVFDGAAVARWDPAAVPLLLYSAVLATAFAYWASHAITRSLSPMGTTLSFLAVPVVGLASGAILLGEALSVLDVVGFASVALGVGVVYAGQGGGWAARLRAGAVPAIREAG